MRKYLLMPLMFFFTVFLFSQELILKVKNSANIIGWVYQKERLDGSYCLYDDNYLIFASSTNQQRPIIHIYKEHSSSIISSNFYISNAQFVALDDENVVLEARFDDLEKYKTRKVHEKLSAKSIAISPNDEMEVVGFENGFVQIHFILKRAKKNFDVHFKAHDDCIYSVNFNAMAQYFITSGKDGKIKIWDTKTLTLVKEFSFYSENLFPAIFSRFDDSFIYCSSRQTLCISDIDGKLQKEIAVMDGIRLAKFTEKKDRIAVLTESKRLEFYNVATGQYEGTINSLENICSFDINVVTGAILVGTEEGEVYLTSAKDIRIKKQELKQVQVKKQPPVNKNDSVENKKDIIDEVTTPSLSSDILRYLGLEDDEDVQEPTPKKSRFPIKDETPLEDPITFTKRAEPSKKAPAVANTKKLNDSVLDDEEIEFNSSYAKPEEEKDEVIDAPNKENEKIEEEEAQQDDEPQEDEVKQGENT